MSTALKLRRGTTAQHASFTGADGEVTLDTDKHTIVVHDGTTAGGFPIASDAQLGTVSSQDADDVAITGGSITGLTSLSTTGNAVVEVTDNSNAALRITQLGTGNALLVEDSANPDSSPVVVNTSGDLVVGYTTATPSTFTNTKNIQSHSTAGRAGFTAARWDDSANGPQLLFGKSRGGAVGTNGIVSSGDSLGAIYFSGDDGTDLVTSGALIEAKVDGTPGTNDMPGLLVFSTTADGASSPTERMRIDSSGNVGIGTSSPAHKLDINGNTNLVSTAYLSWNGSSSYSLQGVGGGSGYIRAITGGNEAMRLTAAGLLQFNSGYGSVATAYGCRAWVNFNGTGTVAIRASGNVSSITDNGTGDYTVNFTTAMPDAKYGCFGWTTGFSTSDPTRHTIIYGSFTSGAAGKTTSGLRVQSGAADASVFADAAEMNVSIIR